jgi:rhodanese-related sulfurtransferase
MSKAYSIFLQAAALLMAGALLGALFNTLRPTHRLPWHYPWSQRVQAQAQAEGVPLLSLAETRAAMERQTHWLLDARTAQEFYTGTIPGALSLPMRDVDEAFVDVQLMILPEESVITFCSGASCDDALLLALFLREQGYTNVAVFAGGIEEWIAADYEVEGGL